MLFSHQIILIYIGWYIIFTLIARFMEPTWGPSGTDRTQVGPMLAPWTLLSGYVFFTRHCMWCTWIYHHYFISRQTIIDAHQDTIPMLFLHQLYLMHVDVSSICRLHTSLYVMLIDLSSPYCFHIKLPRSIIDIHEWHSHEWKLLANNHTRDQKLFIHGKPYISFPVGFKTQKNRWKLHWVLPAIVFSPFTLIQSIVV